MRPNRRQILWLASALLVLSCSRPQASYEFRFVTPGSTDTLTEYAFEMRLDDTTAVYGTTVAFRLDADKGYAAIPLAVTVESPDGRRFGERFTVPLETERPADLPPIRRLLKDRENLEVEAPWRTGIRVGGESAGLWRVTFRITGEKEARSIRGFGFHYQPIEKWAQKTN